MAARAKGDAATALEEARARATTGPITYAEIWLYFRVILTVLLRACRPSLRLT